MKRLSLYTLIVVSLILLVSCATQKRCYDKWATLVPEVVQVPFEVEIPIYRYLPGDTVRLLLPPATNGVCLPETVLVDSNPRTISRVKVSSSGLQVDCITRDTILRDTCRLDTILQVQPPAQLAPPCVCPRTGWHWLGIIVFSCACLLLALKILQIIKPF